MQRIAAFMFSGLGIFAFDHSAAAQTYYTAVPLQLPTGDVSSYVGKINNVGQVIGSAQPNDYYPSAIVWNDAVPTVIDSFGIDEFQGINDLGVVVGNSKYDQSVWDSNGYPNLGFGYIHGINDAGVIVGVGEDSPIATTAYAISWIGPNATTQTILPKLGGPRYSSSEASAVNFIGMIVGTTYFSDQTSHATLWSGSTAVDLGNLGGANASASSINNSNQVVGSADIVNGAYHATLWTGGKKVDLGTLGGPNSAANWINNSGTIVGTADTSAGAQHAALFVGGKVIDLNSVVPTLPANLTLTDAQGINDDGWVVANALDKQSGNSFGYLLKPQQAQQPPDSVQSDFYADTAMGVNALAALQYGGSNDTAAGAYALAATTTGTANTALGASALRLNTTGANNTASGVGALEFNTTGGNNVAQGNSALYANITGSNNVAMGENALSANTTGNGNTAVGGSAMKGNSRGANNVSVGHDSLYAATGSDNIAIGASAGDNLTTGSNNIDIGNAGNGTESGIIRIGTAGSETAAYIAGIESAKVTGSAVYVTTKGQLGVLASSERYKTDVAPIGTSSGKLHQLRPVSFHLKSEPDGQVQYGLIAEEVARVYPELVIHDDAGNIQGVRYEELAPMLLNEMQRQAAEIRELKQHYKQFATQAELNDLKQQLHAALAALESKSPLVAKR